MRCRILHTFIISCILTHFNIVYAWSGSASTPVYVTHLIQSLRNSIRADKQKSQDLQQQLKTAEISIGSLTKDIVRFNQALEKEQKTLANLRIEQNKTVKKFREQTKLVTQQIRTAYFLGGAQQWKILLNQQDLNTINRHFAYYRYLSQSRLKLISETKQTLTTLKENIKLGRQHQSTLENLLKEKQLQQVKQQRFLDLRQTLLNQLNEQAESKEQQIQSLLANQRELESTLNRLRNNNYLNKQPFAALQKQLAWPVNGSVIAYFGSLLDTGNHLTGVIIKTPSGTPVHSIFKGKVIFANWLRGFGLLVIVDHGNNYMSLYARNQALYAEVGDFVDTGDIIALTGNSGGFKEPSLYFEIRQNGTPTNPTLWCRN